MSPSPTSRPRRRRARIELLRQFFRTFPFADAARLYDPDLAVEIVDLTKPAGLDESSFLAALLTAVCRQSLDLAPGFLCDAPNFSGAGTGKGLLVKAICVIASGVRPSAFTSGHDAEEFDKRLTAALIEAHPAVFLDNFNSKNLTSDILASVLTESPAMVRPMGHTKTVPLHTRTFIGITGNGVQIAEDMARRLLNTHLDAHMENPEQRKFAPGFLDRVFAERANLLAAALTIWRWGRQTEPKPGKPLGSYEVWAQWCRDPLLALGIRDPVDRIAEIKAADPKRRELIAIFEQWWAAHGDAAAERPGTDHEVIKLDPRCHHARRRHQPTEGRRLPRRTRRHPRRRIRPEQDRARTAEQRSRALQARLKPRGSPHDLRCSFATSPHEGFHDSHNCHDVARRKSRRERQLLARSGAGHNGSLGSLGSHPVPSRKTAFSPLGPSSPHPLLNPLKSGLPGDVLQVLAAPRTLRRVTRRSG